MSSDSSKNNSSKVPVAQAIAAPMSPPDMSAAAASPAQRWPEEVLPQATAVVNLTDVGAVSTTAASIRDMIQKEMCSAFKKEHKRNADLFSAFQVTIMKEVSESVSQETAAFLKNYARHDLPEVINSRVNILFPRFAADSSLIKQHLDRHLRAMDEEVTSRKKEAAFELEAVAQAAAGGGGGGGFEDPLRPSFLILFWLPGLWDYFNFLFYFFFWATGFTC
jgi:hypothetical protein